MSEQVEKAIVDLLYQQNQLSLVGLGTFVVKPKATTIDPVQGHIRPPAKEITFDHSLTINDGLLLGELQKQGISTEAAEALLNEYISEIQQTLDKKEIFTFPKVGRLYRDYENNLKFLPDTTNFAPASFGLPDIQFYPVIRSKQEEPVLQDPIITTTSTDTSRDVSGSISNWFQKRLPLIAILTAIVLATGLFLLIKDQRTKLQRNRTAQEVPTDRVNIAPGEADSDLPAAEAIEQEADTQEDSVIDESEDGDATEAPTLYPDTKVGIITIGMFGNKDNVNKLVQRLYEAGYEPYTEEKGRLTLVGVQFPYATSSELDQMLRDVRNEFETKARVYQR